MPAETTVTVLPLTVQTAVVVDAKVIGSIDDTVALTVNGAAPYTLAASVPNVIV